MKDTIILLIEDDIRINQLVSTLGKIGIDASNVSFGTSKAIFDLMGIDRNNIDSNLLYDRYFHLIEKGSDLESYRGTEQITGLAHEIFGFLESIKHHYA